MTGHPVFAFFRSETHAATGGRRGEARFYGNARLYTLIYYCIISASIYNGRGAGGCAQAPPHHETGGAAGRDREASSADPLLREERTMPMLVAGTKRSQRPGGGARRVTASPAGGCGRGRVDSGPAGA